MKAWARDAFRSVGRYVAVFGGGFALFMGVAPIVGYSTYGDRPPAGWQGWFPPLDWASFPGYLVFIVEFLGLLLLPWAMILFLLPLALVRWMERRALPRWVTAVVGAALTTLVSGYALLGAAWYVSLGLAPFLVGIVLAAYVGACHLPRAVRVDRAA